MQELIPFVALAMTSGAVGNATYDGLKVILGTQFNTLKNYIDSNEREKFEVALNILLENEELKDKLERFQKGESITHITQTHYGEGDNVAGDKVMGDKFTGNKIINNHSKDLPHS